jgi:hypothetical protein
LEKEADVMGKKALQMRRPDYIATDSSAQMATAVQGTAETRDASAVAGAAIGSPEEKVRLNFLSTPRPSGHTIQRLNKQSTLGKPRKEGKTYPNLDFDDLAKNQELKMDLERHERGVLEYFTTEFKKQFKVRATSAGLQRDGKSMPPGMYGYVVSPKGGLYAIAHPDEEARLSGKGITNTTFYHSLFRAGEPVQSAGFFEYDGSLITYINRSSGHYRPTEEQHLRAVLGLHKAGYLSEQTLVGGIELLGTYKSILKYNDEQQKIATLNNHGIKPLLYFGSATRTASQSELDNECRQRLGRADVGIYHPGAVRRDFDHVTAERILAGEPGPFRDLHGHSYKFVHKSAQGDFFFEFI